MRWPDDATGWPLTEHSRMILARPHRWHVQEAGSGPTLLLIHGAGGATQSWRSLFPILARDFHVVAMDLPGQGFTQLGARMRCGLDPMAEDLRTLIDTAGWQPAALIGQSAGAALALRLNELMPAPLPVVGINAALDRFEGVAGWLFPMLAKALALAPFTADIFARTASSAASVKRLIASTGSTLTPDGLALYRRLVSDRDHVDATLAMMSQWSVDGLLSRLPDHPEPVLLMAGGKDGAVPPRVSRNAVDALPNGRFHLEDGLGHLMHEEAAERTAEIIHEFLAEHL